MLTFTLPIAVLVGVLIGLGRMSADSELIALSALGVGLRRVLRAGGRARCRHRVILTLAHDAMGRARGAAHHPSDFKTELLASQASFQIQPRVFDERFPHMVLYVEDATASATHWRGVFLAETGWPRKLATYSGGRCHCNCRPRARASLELHLRDGSTHEYRGRAAGSLQRFDVWPRAISRSKFEEPAQAAPASRAMRSARSSDTAGGNGSGTARRSRSKLQERFAFPGACMVFALLAVPLAARPRRGGRAMGFIVSLLLVCGYYLILCSAPDSRGKESFRRRLGIWAANFFTGFFGLALLPGMEHIRGENWFHHALAAISAWVRDLRFRQDESGFGGTRNERRTMGHARARFRYSDPAQH